MNIYKAFEKLQYRGLNFTNFEMETAGIYGLAKLLGHRALSINAIIANRRLGEFAKDPESIVTGLIDRVMRII